MEARLDVVGLMVVGVVPDVTGVGAGGGGSGGGGILGARHMMLKEYVWI
jgi:hypothetical protein